MPLEHEHTREAIRLRLREGARPSYLRDWVYGGIDGAVTTFAVIAGVAGAGLSAKIVVILGLANLVADGFSMAASNYSGTKTEVDDANRLRKVERRHIRMAPEGEREEIRQILGNKGLSGWGLKAAVEAITSNEKTWVETMLTEEYGLAPTLRSPIRAATHTFLAFVTCGSVPLLPYLWHAADPFAWAIALTSFVFFAIGSAKSRWSLALWWRSGLETLGIGTAAAALAYGVGYLLRGLAGPLA